MANKFRLDDIVKFMQLKACSHSAADTAVALTADIRGISLLSVTFPWLLTNFLNTVTDRSMLRDNLICK